MIDLSGLCSTHGIVLFKHDDGVGQPDASNTIDAPNYVLPLSEGWYWATHQHGVLTGKPNGPYANRAMALSAAAMIMAAYENDDILAQCNLG